MVGADLAAPATTVPRSTRAASDAFARDLAALVADLRAVPTEGRTFVGERRTNRGGVIADHDAWVQTCLARSAGLLDVAALAALWERLRELPRGPAPDVTTHGDLIPGNVLVARHGAPTPGWPGCSTSAAPARPTRRSTSSAPGTCSTTGPGRRSARRSACDDATWARGVGLGVRAGGRAGLVLPHLEPAVQRARPPDPGAGSCAPRPRRTRGAHLRETLTPAARGGLVGRQRFLAAGRAGAWSREQGGCGVMA